MMSLGYTLATSCMLKLTSLNPREMSTDRAALLRNHFSTPNQELRPILTSVNGDNSWLISFPRPAAERETAGKAYFHAVHDPWLKGSATLISTWLVNIDLAAPASVTDGEGVEAVVREIESAATGSPCTAPSPLVDVIFVNLDNIDHLHRPTLSTFDASIPVFAAPDASIALQEWGYFDTVVTNKEIQPDDGNWKTLHPGAPLPEWLTIFHMKGHHTLNFATAMIWSPDPNTHEALLYSPHGIATSEPSVRTLLHRATPAIKVLAIMHGLKESRTWGWLNTFGVQYGLPLYREAQAKYWVLTHNMPLRYSGIVMKGVTEIRRTLEWGLGWEKEEVEAAGRLEREEVNFVEVENGGFAVLEYAGLQQTQPQRKGIIGV
jgi:hypothetical protein